MTAHRAAYDMFKAEATRTSSVNAEALYVDASPLTVHLSSAGAETRTLARPTRQNALVVVHMQTDGGDVTLTVTGGYNQDGDTTFVFSAEGQWALFQSRMTKAGVYFWQKISDYAAGNIDPADAAILEGFSGLTATVAELNQAADESANSEIVVTTNVITADESGKTFFLGAAGGFTSTLPAPALGLRFRFIVSVAPTTAYIVTTTTSANILFGMMLERVGTAGVAGAARDTFNFVANNAIIGDWVEFYCDGTNYLYHGMVDAAAGNTVAAT